MNPYANNETVYTTTPMNQATYPQNVPFMHPILHLGFQQQNMHTNTQINEASFPFIDPIMDNLYSENVISNFSLQPAPSVNLMDTTIGNANSILYGMDNYVNDVP